MNADQRGLKKKSLSHFLFDHEISCRTQSPNSFAFLRGLCG
jgi:hypothetical protein